MSQAPFKSGVALSFLAGLAVSPFVKPLLRSTAKASVRVGLQAKKLASGAVEDFQDLAAEARAAEARTDSATTPATNPASTASVP